LEVYDIANNQIMNAVSMGTVGLNWQAMAFGNFSSIPGQTDMIMRDTNTGAMELYNIANNQITGATLLGTVGLDWQFAGVAPVHAGGASDLVLRNVNTGAFEVYNIANNQITGAALLGAVGLNWGVAALPLIRRQRPRAVQMAQPLSSCRRWQALQVAVAQVRA
jgi:hypothetical protein